MRAFTITGLVLASAYLFGCSAEKHSGDLGAFIVNQVKSYGGRVQEGKSLPPLDGNWTIIQDTNGFEIIVTGQSFSAIDDFMTKAFGSPVMVVAGNETGTGYPHRLWKGIDIGVAIQLNGQEDGAKINCLRGMDSIGQLF